MKPLKSIQSSIPRARKEAIDKLINDAVRSGMAIDRESAFMALDELVAASSKSPLKAVTKVRKAIVGEVMSSKDWNITQQEVFIDLHSTYRQLNNIGNLDDARGEIGSGEFKKSRAAIIKAISEIKAYQFLREHPSYQDVKFINFDDTRNFHGKKPKAYVDNKARTLELAPNAKKFLQAGNLKLGGSKIRINRLGSGVLGGLQDQFPVENIVDANPDTFWADLVLTDSRVRQTYVTSTGTQHLSEGLIAEVDVELNQIGRINTLRLLPFGPFPIKVLDIIYKESPHADTWLSVPGFLMQDPTLDWFELTFKPITVGKLRIVIEQTNYTNQIFHLPENLVNDQSLWTQIIRERSNTTLENSGLSNQDIGKVAAEPEMMAYIKAVNDVDTELRAYSYSSNQGSDEYNVSVNLIKATGAVLNRLAKGAGDELITTLGGVNEEKTRLVEIRKNEFIYGIRELEMSMSLYRNLGNWASPKYNSSGTILKVSLDTKETHPIYSDGTSEYKRTSIEYDLNLGDGIRKPILPETAPKIPTPTGDKYLVEDEYIEIPRFTTAGVTRFQVEGVNITVRRNGKRLISSEYSFTIDAVSGRGILTINSGYHANSTYTITYVAKETANVINVNDIFDSTRLSIPETFDSTGSNNAIRLMYYPYVEYEIVNDKINWVREDLLDAKWRFLPTMPLYSIGTVNVTNSVTSVTGLGTTWSTSLDPLKTNYLKVGLIVTRILSIDSDTTLTLAEPFEGDSDSTAAYSISQGITLDNIAYKFSDMFYEPISVYVNDVKAHNLTDYYAQEHPAFVPQGRFSRGRQFIHIGQMLYFNESIEGAAIEVTYNWLTQYVQLESTLRCNIPVQTTVTPKVNNMTLKIKNSVL